MAIVKNNKLFSYNIIPKQITKENIKATLYLHNWPSFPDKFGCSESDVLHSAHAQSASHRSQLIAQPDDIWHSTSHLESNAWLRTMCVTHITTNSHRSAPIWISLDHYQCFDYKPGKRNLVPLGFLSGWHSCICQTSECNRRLRFRQPTYISKTLGALTGITGPGHFTPRSAPTLPVAQDTIPAQPKATSSLQVQFHPDMGPFPLTTVRACLSDCNLYTSAFTARSRSTQYSRLLYSI